MEKARLYEFDVGKMCVMHISKNNRLIDTKVMSVRPYFVKLTIFVLALKRANSYFGAVRIKHLRFGLITFSNKLDVDIKLQNSGQE